MPFTLKPTFIHFIFLLSTFVTQAQTVIRGTLYDNTTSETLIGASVIVKGTTTGVTTDFDGNFSLKTNLPLPVTIVVSYIGYANQEIEVASTDKLIKIKLKSDDIQLEGVEIVGSRISEKEKESPVTIESMDAIAIKETPSADFYAGLGNLKGVDLTAASIGFKIINTRGFNSTKPVRSLQIIDGIDNQAPGLNFSLGNFLGSPESDIQEVELIVGAAGAMYGPNAFNGVIKMETKDPFVHKGLTLSAKVGERQMQEVGFRYADVFKNKAGKDKWAYKVNAQYMKAYDWEAANTAKSDTSKYGETNPGGYDAVNVYGDEPDPILIDGDNGRSEKLSYPGMGGVYRPGYIEPDLANYNTKNLKLNGALHYKITDDVRIKYAFDYGNGTTIYQGDNRFSLNDFHVRRHVIELFEKDKFFVRFFDTKENAGNTYDIVRTGYELLDQQGDYVSYVNEYKNLWKASGGPASQLKGYSDWPSATLLLTPEGQQQWEEQYATFVTNHAAEIATMHNQVQQQIVNDTTQLNYLVPGTAEFEKALSNITNTLATDGGTKFYDESSMRHFQTQYMFTPAFGDITVGGAFRAYRPVSNGVIFSDTGDVQIKNNEFGIYSGVKKKVYDEKILLNAIVRFDKNDNFKGVLSPALSAVYMLDETKSFRFSATSAIRNPTLMDQYQYMQVGRGKLLGNLTGYDSLVTKGSYLDAQNLTVSPAERAAQMEWFNVDPIRPEQVKSLELGFKGSFGKNFYIDASAYRSWYKDFIGYKVGLLINPTTTGYIDAYRIAANASDIVVTNGASTQLTYYFKKYYALSGNYSWNILDKRGSMDDIIPAFNTPEHKFNIGVSGRDLIAKTFLGTIKNVGFSINYKWIQGFLFEGSPQFTGYIDTYDMLDTQISYKYTKINTTFKLGASNVLNNKVYMVYGGPLIGRMAYFSILVELVK